MRRPLLLLTTLVIATSSFARDAAQLQIALRKLANVGGALYVAAHPDDENTAFLAWSANERGYRTAYLSVTRGDGGQNLIGDEKGPLLGVIRTQELLAARRIDGAEQMFTRAIDFGYSKTPAETLAIWGREAVLADVVWAIRKFQPDVIVTRFPTNGEGGHGHHTASAMLAEEAFVAAADPTKFPEQLKWVSPWQAKRIFWNRFSFRPVDPNDPALANSLRVDLGTFNPLLGRAYTEIAAESRSEHKSQGFGSAERRGSILNYFDLRAGEPAQKDLFEGVDSRWSRYPGGEKIGEILQRAADTFDVKDPQASLPLLLQAHNAFLQLRANPEWSLARKPWLEQKQRELLEAIRECAGIAIDVAAADSMIAPGQKLPVSVTVVNRSDYPFRLSMVASLFANPSKAPGVKLENNKPIKTDIVLELPDATIRTQPYWLAQPPSRGLYTVTQQELVGRPDNPIEIPIRVSLDDPSMNTLIFTVPTVFRWTDPVQGEQVREVDALPPVDVRLGSNVYIFPDAKPRPVTVSIRSLGGADSKLDTTVSLALPQGWKSEPASVPMTFTGKGAEGSAMFNVTPPAGESTAMMRAEVKVAGMTVTEGVAEIDYPHIPAQRILGDANAMGVRADIKRRGSRIGYVMGSGDDVANILRQVGYDVVLLSDTDLDRGDFANYDAIVTGIRAYNTRKRLKSAHARLMQYVENGGTLVVQYNTANGLGDLVVDTPGPYPMKISRDRVTVEEAPVRFIDATHPLLAAPNKITAADFEGWVQERGLYFPGEWDAKYTPLFAMNDPNEPEKTGAQLHAKHGKGAFIYTGLAWWRQLPAGVPGAIKAFVNLVSAE
ncbi:MAG TPA: PIG-L family deacetylase [Thermoanaerobaculia bacterium]|nr:PIG-L family deacetylase [Thermoanaerobaculia bacterium]